jgi:hypothetical protein
LPQRIDALPQSICGAPGNFGFGFRFRELGLYLSNLGKAAGFIILSGRYRLLRSIEFLPGSL